ncbi:MAG: Rossmann-like domain-containing protein, partial [Anaerolineae bacterium]
GKTVVMVGHFPYVPDLRPRVGRLLVLEQNPQDELDIPAERAPEVIPQADVLAITAMTLLNRTFDDLIALRRPGVPMVIVGPTTPLTPILFEMGAVILSGAVVENPETVLRGLRQGANFHQLRQMGVRLVSMATERL